MRPWNVRNCGICGGRKVWVGDPDSIGVRRRVCLQCDRVGSDDQKVAM